MSDCINNGLIVYCMQRLERPLQDYVQSTSAHPWDHHAFRTFSTPTPLRVIQVNQDLLDL